VEIENINRNLEEGKEIEQAILDGAAQIAIPAFVSTLSICIVFVPMFFLGGVAKYLFVPLAEAVVFAMLASYFLSRTVVPTMAKFLLVEHDAEAERRKHQSRNPFIRFQLAFERRFEQLRHFYHGLLALAVARSYVFLILFLFFCVGSFALLYPWLGQDFFPSVDAGQFKLHVRARTGTRIEETARLCDQIDSAIRREIPARELVTIIDNIGIPYSGLNLSYGNSGVVGSADADITVSLTKDHRPTNTYVEDLRKKLAQEFPGVTFYTLPVDMTTQILNFGLPAPIDVQVIGQNQAANHDFAEKLMQEIKYVPGTADLHIQQPFNQPRLFVDVDRSRSQDIGLTQRDVAGSLLVALSGSFQTSPTFWLNPKNGVSYNISTQTPQYSLDSLGDLESVPITASVAPNSNANFNMFTPAAQMGGKPIQILGNLSSVTRGEELATVTHYNIQPVIDIYGNIDNTDLRSVADKIRAIIAKHSKERPYLNSSNPSTALNPFVDGAAGSPQLLASLLTPLPLQKFYEKLHTVNGFVRGPILQLPSGPIELVLGGEYDRNSLDASRPPAAAQSYYRSNHALFGEARVPILAHGGDSQAGDVLAATLAGWRWGW